MRKEKVKDLELYIEGKEHENDGHDFLEVHENGGESYVRRSPVTGISLLRAVLVFVGVLYTVFFSLTDRKMFYQCLEFTQ